MESDGGSDLEDEDRLDENEGLARPLLEGADEVEEDDGELWSGTASRGFSSMLHTHRLVSRNTNVVFPTNPSTVSTIGLIASSDSSLIGVAGTSRDGSKESAGHTNSRDWAVGD